MLFDFGFASAQVSQTWMPFGNGIQVLFRFDNGFGASVVMHEGSYGGRNDMWEMALIRWTDGDWDLVYIDDRDSPFRDVAGFLSDDGVAKHLADIAAFPEDKFHRTNFRPIEVE